MAGRRTRRLAAGRGASYSDAVVVETPPCGTWVFISGQLPLDADGEVLRTDLLTQATACIDRIEDLLGRCGAGLENVVKITTYVTDMSEYGTLNDLRAKRFANALPASAAVQVADLLGGAAIEMDAVAFVSA